VKKVPKIDHLGCFLTPFRPTLTNNTQPTTHNVQHHELLFVNHRRSANYGYTSRGED
jgi:hypothetical protein